MYFGDSSEYFDYDWTEDLSDEEYIRLQEEGIKERKKEREKEHNVIRDKRGRLNKGARLAEKESCNENEIWSMYTEGNTVKEIVSFLGCSKSTAYNIIKRRRDVKMYLLYLCEWSVSEIAQKMKCTDNAVIRGIKSREKKKAKASILENHNHELSE